MDTESLYTLFKSQGIVTTDSRNCPPGSLFFALRGTSFDGNKFASQALSAGCSYAVVDDPSVAVDSRYLLVDDVLQALQALARHHRREWGGTVVGITGTNGKTTTKELMSACLSRRYKVLATEGNLNNSIGVPLTLLRLDSSHEMAVIEMGASHPGDIAELVDIAEPDFGLITNVGRGHLLGFGSFEGVVDTKCELYDFLRTHGGKVFLRHEDEILSQRAVGLVGKEHFDVDTKLIGSYNLPNALAAAAVASYFDVQPSDIVAALSAYEPHNKRSQLIRTSRNTLIVDAYNANPTSMGAALDNFCAAELPCKMAILGDMGELGNESEAEHRRVVERLAGESGIEILWVGSEFMKAAGGMTCFSDTEALIDFLKASVITGRTILIKGSRFMKLEKCIDYL